MFCPSVRYTRKCGWFWVVQPCVENRNRFLNTSSAALRRRQKRAYARSHRNAKAEEASRSERTGSRHRKYPCCGKRRVRCTCFSKNGRFAAVASACNKRLLRDFKKRLWKVKLLKVADTKDVSVLVERYEKAMRRNYAWAFFWSIVCRLYNHESTWDAFENRYCTTEGHQPSRCLRCWILC